MAKKIIILLIAIIVLLISAGVGAFMWLNKDVKHYTVDPGDAFVTNVVGSNYLLKADILIETSNKKTSKFLTANDFKVRDVIIKVLRSKSYEEITNTEIQSIIEQEVIQELTNVYKLENIDSIYFSEFVVQQ